MATIALDATLTVEPNPMGSAVYSRRLIECLASLATPHHFLLCYRLSRLRQYRRFLRPRRAPEPSRPTFSLRIFQEPFTFWLRYEAEVFHSLGQRPPAFRFPKEIVTIHDVIPLTGRDYSTPEYQRKFSGLLLQAVARAVRVVTPTQHSAEQLIQHTGARRDQVRVIPLGVDLPETQMSPERRREERERFVGKGCEMLLSVGAIDNRKNTLNILRALERMPAHYHLVIAGKDGYGSQAVHDFIRREQLTSRVSVLGYVPGDRLASLYEASSALVFVSFEEGFGLPLLEAMAHGVPVVASQASCLPEVCGNAALFADPHDHAEIAERIMQIVEDGRLREKMIQQGWVRAREFPWCRTAEETCRVYDEVLAL
ncbi:MAG: glycosyltransferase family 4 protein [Acidobacteriia bacterium]|nr:glycosyltransferase family 4 protein [Terriglobia bacterium]